ncbi:MAG: HAMP domain-containing histidine kinase [Acetatifactor sp.]|nr:HAMP domain-containing histidine kinase [Acetatifactor sp.]
MEWIKRMSLKKSLFTMALISLAIAALLSAIPFLLGMELSTRLFPYGEAIFIDGSYAITENVASAPQTGSIDALLIILQVILPILFFVIALLATVFLFYRWKLKEPLKILMDGANHIIENDLDFTIEVQSTDELGQLCTAFETMRQTLLKSNRELWRQAEERKRLNAAFSHDLRNPITVLKGSIEMAKKCVVSETEKTDQLLENLTRIKTYTGRIERYVEAMSNVGRLEQIQIERVSTDSGILAHELENAMRFVVVDSGKQLSFSSTDTVGKIHVDKNALFQITENLISNAIRFAIQKISVNLSYADDMLILEVVDDGSGFPVALLKNGIQPFQKGNEDAEHFGMGLYICDLLCRKHGGCVEIINCEQGASVSAILKIS